MHKKRVFTTLLTGVLIIFILAIILSGNLRFTAFTVFAGGNTFCKATFSDDSSFTANQDCSAGGNGGNASGVGITLNCASFTARGDSLDPATSGIITTANDVIIRRCNIGDFGFGINISSNNATVADTILTALGVIAGGGDVFLLAGQNATIINTTYRGGELNVQAGANAYIQYYVVINITNTSGQVNAATVSVYNDSTGGSRLSASTGSNGLVYFNITRGVKTNSAHTNFTYWINATAAGSQYGENATAVIPISTSITQININISGPADSTPPLVTINQPINKTLNSLPVLFNVTVNEDSTTAQLSLNAGINNVTMQNNANRDFNTTNTSLADGSYTARYYVNDTANNYNNTERRSFTLDTIFPGIQYQTPTETASVFISRSNIQVNVTATDTNSLTNITIQLFNSSGARIRYNTTSTSPNSINYTGLADGLYTFNATAADAGNNINSTASRNITIDTATPLVQFVSPTLATAAITTNNNLTINVTATDTNLANITIQLFNSSGARIRYNTTTTSPNNITYPGLADGDYTINATATDLANTINATESRTVTIDATNPGVTINSPTGITYSVDNAAVNITLNENGTCLFSLDAGAANTTTTNLINRQFTGNTPSLVNGVKTLNAYCNDTAGNQNNSQSISFTISVASAGSGSSGGGGSPACISEYSCGAWSACSNGKQERTCKDTKCSKPDKIESQNCTCIKECGQIGLSCSGNTAQTCELINGCLKVTAEENCGTAECKNGKCILPTEEEKVIKVTGNFSVLPSKWIPHGNIPDIVIDAGTPIVLVGAIAWLWWLWILAALPFFLLKLKHYSVSIMDSSNELKIFGKHLDKQRLITFLQNIEKSYGKLITASKSQELIKYLTEKGFVEITLDEPFILTAHFTSKADADKFESALRRVLINMHASKLPILRIKEKASVIGAWRAYRRRKKSEREIARFAK